LLNIAKIEDVFADSLFKREKITDFCRKCIIVMIYQLTYELATPGMDYAPLYHLIETEIGRSALHVLRDTWWIDCDNSVQAYELCTKIRSKIGDTDTFVVTELSDTNVNGWLNSNSWEWRRKVLDGTK
jgi:hypothetical protein